MSIPYNEPEELVPPDMEEVEIAKIINKKEFPIIKLTYAVISSLGILIFVCIGLIIYSKTHSMLASLPFWMAALLMMPFATYFFYSLASTLTGHKGHNKLEERDAAN